MEGLYYMKILLGDFNTKLGREDIFKPIIGQESLLQDSNDNGVRLVNFATSIIWLLKARCSLAGTFINTPGPPLMTRLTTRLTTY
jgi:hypothetical protein